jgi:hexosaminidase
MNLRHTYGLFPAPRLIHSVPDDEQKTPASLRLISHVNAGCGEAFCRGFSLAAPKQGRQSIIGHTGLPLMLIPSYAGEQDYRIALTTGCIRVEASTAVGFQYAGTTLGHVMRANPETLPGLVIEDSPVFAKRGVMLDISRNKVPTMASLFELVDRLASWKINHFQLYTEHTFAYAKHAAVWHDASPMTAREIQALDEYCRMLNIELAANQNSFGHLQRWLKHPDYRHLAESPDGYTTPWGEKRDGPFSLNPLDPKSLQFLSGLYEELLPNFTSTLFNVGCDETFDLGQGASKEACETLGKGRVYVNFLNEIKKLVEKNGRTMMFWGDIILNHPELIPELQKDAIALVWGYEADHPFVDQCRAFAQSGMPFWVCPGTSTWNSITGRFDNARTNIDTAAKAGRDHGAAGFMVTEWGDNGHWQTLPFSTIALATGAAAAWCGESPVPSELMHMADHTDTVIELGRVYLDAGFPIHNTSPVFSLLRYKSPTTVLDQWTVEALAMTDQHIESALARIPPIVGSDPATKLWRDEISLGGMMLRHAIFRGLWLKAGKPADNALLLNEQIHFIHEELSRLWLTRNRRGGLSESLIPLEMRLREYHAV